MTHLFALWGGLPSEASPSVPLHFVEREGPEIGVVGFRQDWLGYVPPLHEVERGPGGEASEGRPHRVVPLPSRAGDASVCATLPPRMLPAFTLLLATLTVLLAAIVALSPWRPLPRWLPLLAGALAALMAGQALWSLRTSPLALLAAVPLAAGVVILGLAAFPRRVRRPPGALRRIAALVGI